MQFAGAVKEPQVCSGVRVGDKVTPSLTQLLLELFAMLRQLILASTMFGVVLRTRLYSLVPALWLVSMLVSMLLLMLVLMLALMLVSMVSMLVPMSVSRFE